MKTLFNLLLIYVVICFNLRANAQDFTERNKQILEMAENIKEYYIFEDVANQLSEKLKSEIELKTFESLTDKEFAKSLSSYLTINGNDLHFNVLYRPSQEEKKIVNEKEMLQKYDSINRQWNYGFEKVTRLDGNIGYIEYTGFPEGNKSAQQILDATMNFVSNTNALIIDLRNNQGGDGKMVKLFLSYFFENKIKLSEHYTRYNDKTIKHFTMQKVNGKKYLNKPIYILVNNKTISAAESLAYNLQQNKIAKIIGDKTYGAANPVKVFFIGNKYHLFIPISEEKNSITNTNWEHAGIDADVKINSEKALIKAQIIALENILKSNTKTELTETEIKEKILKLKEQL
ncbi:S41 family peptidase [Flavobacterium sinopsychrotolerans]|uniref:Peptidase family S41 n=1 Tax=Flavobacterium sinopsychrotolerans TaxID=604089 RepID=A0A1H8RTK3_9FLAO|nr:S41 family peptidase [Flavobacterium sinopsychrotolerans]SEO69488.1 Peptidase family S41 [Flavobacterium sinopsychrotolerans]